MGNLFIPSGVRHEVMLSSARNKKYHYLFRISVSLKVPGELEDLDGRSALDLGEQRHDDASADRMCVDVGN